MLEYEIVIIGGGPAGATAAKYLSRAGIKTLLVQRNMSFKKPCGGGIRLDAFSEFEIDTGIIRKYVDTIALVHKDDRVEVDISQTPIGIVDRQSFDAMLRQDAQDAGTTLLEAVFVSLEHFEDHVVSTIKVDEEYIKVRSSYLIGADGVNSKVRKIVNGDRVSSSMTHYADITTKEYGVCEFHFGSEVAERLYAWVFPHAEGSNIGTLAESDQSYLNRLIENLDIDEDIKALGYRIPHYHNTLFYKDRVFFVGDSASQVLPFTYEGIYYAMSSAKILADVIINDEDPKSYEKRWSEKYKNKFTALLILQKIFLRNDFMISLMMRLYHKRYIQEQMVRLWLGKREVKIGIKFFFNVFKQLITR
ncbi:MAG: geranylgeranyl reductase family protein [Epsilonproteobacteria bacterium]|nr:geranylgeranyl reductase family protein [Campylobacterota bacterium]